MILFSQVKTSLFWLAKGLIVTKSPLFLFKWFKVHFDIGLIQLNLLFTAKVGSFSLIKYLNAQWIIGDLLWNLDFQRRMETIFEVSFNLPHVDTLAKKKQSKIKSDVPAPILVEVVLLGAGHAHAYVLKKFGMNPIEGVKLTVITEQGDTPYSGMLPGEVAGDYTHEESHIDVINLCQFAKVVFIQARAISIDRKNKRISLEGDRPSISYDVLSLDIGSSPMLLDKESVEAATITITAVKPISLFSKRWSSFILRVQNSGKKHRIGVVGAGAGGVDLILSMNRRLQTLNVDYELVLFSATDSVCPTHNKAGQNLLQSTLIEKGIELKLSFVVDRIVGDKVYCENKSEELDEVFWCTNAAGGSLLSDSGFACTDNGFIKVHKSLESINTELVFAAGDCCHIVDDPCPKAGVFAVRQGPVLADNIVQACLALQKVKKASYLDYIPQRNFLGIIGRQDECIATKGEMAIKASWLWDLKQWIDQKWLSSYNNLPNMSPPDSKINSRLDAVKLQALMRCCGCGSKVPARSLSRALNRVGLDKGTLDDCSILPLSDITGKKIIQSVDFFKAFIQDPYIFGKIAALHSLSDIHAMGGKPISALALCIVPFAEPKVTEEILFQLLSGCMQVLKEEDCELQGGHSTEGNELSMGLSVTGLCEENKILRKSGAKVGDKIILTKRLGTGILLAAQMKQKAKCFWMTDALDSMLLSNQSAGNIFLDYASSCTDVTGFGLAGHLIEVLRASDLSAELNLDRIPILNGACEMSSLGIKSSLFEENLNSSKYFEPSSTAAEHSKFKLLFDPQTSGGLLATVSSSQVEKVIGLLHKNGYKSACVIGEVCSKISPDKLVKIKS